MEGLATSYTCKHCNSDYSGSFCPQCGQRYIDQRITLKHTLGSLFQSIFNFDKGLWPTTWLMFRNPGRVISGYLNGITLPYFHPFRFVFFWLTAQVLFLAATGIYADYQNELNLQMNGGAIPPELMDLLGLFYAYMNIWFLLALPFLAFGSWLVFRKQHYNFAEHLVISAYAYGGITFIGLFTTPFIMTSASTYSYASFLTLPVTFFYLAYVYRSLFKQNWILLFFKSFFTFLLFMIGFSLVMIGLFFIYTSLINPDFMANMSRAAEEAKP